MKKIVSLFFLSLMFACDAELGERPDFNPVLGQWDVLDNDGKILHTRVYTNQYYAYFLVIDGQVQTNIDSAYYVIHENKLIFDRFEQTYSIIADTLWITNSKGSKVTKYIRKKTT